MLGTLLKDGMEVTNDPAQAEVVIVNTCSFIDSAQAESIDAVLESDAVRTAKNRNQALIVSGCLPQRFREQLPALLPEVDAFMGIDQVPQVAELVRRVLARRVEQPRRNSKPDPTRKPQHNLDTLAREVGNFGVKPSIPSGPLVEVNARPTYIPDYGTPRYRLTPRHFAYIKIAEGCNHPCTFCIIPQMRGSHRSRPQNDLIKEARALLADGVKELNLISQDSTYYGLDLRPSRTGGISSPERFGATFKALPEKATTICSLLRELNAVPGDFWIRLLYTHPAHWTDELIETIANCPKVARYVDIPLQHIHQNMLERMRRETSQEYIVELLHRIRAGIPGIALRTTFIVGFPGETQASFEALLDFIRQARFERLGVFTYSQQEGTRAGKMAGQISERIKRQRQTLAMAAQHQVATEVSEAVVGRTLKVLIEKRASSQELRGARVQSWEHGLLRGTDKEVKGLDGTYLVARSEADAPDIDGRVYVRGQLPIGDFAQVKIIGHTDYDLIATPAAS